MESQFHPSPEAESDPLLQLIERLAWHGRTDIPPEDLRSAWTRLEGLLTERVGERLGAGLSQAEFDEFSALGEDTTRGDDGEDAAARWLRLHVPDYRAIVNHETATITGQAAAWFDSHYPPTPRRKKHDRSA